jgi:hypothetical protein
VKTPTSADGNAQPFELIERIEPFERIKLHKLHKPLKRHKPLKLFLNSLMIGENTNIGRRKCSTF